MVHKAIRSAQGNSGCHGAYGIGAHSLSCSGCYFCAPFPKDRDKREHFSVLLPGLITSPMMHWGGSERRDTSVYCGILHIPQCAEVSLLSELPQGIIGDIIQPGSNRKKIFPLLSPYSTPKWPFFCK